ACGSAHHWARRFREQGHEVRLIAPQFVKPFVKSNKNDAADAEAICEAVQRPNMRFVAIDIEQQDIQAILHALVGRWATHGDQSDARPAAGVWPRGRRAALQRRRDLEDAENGLSERFRAELRRLYEELQQLNGRVLHYDTQIDQIAKDNAQAQALIQLLRRRRQRHGAVGRCRRGPQPVQEWPGNGGLARTGAASTLHRR
ncbi:hypothetical protein U5801_28030, partial [Lamprobacter modestohalophilus]|nr:hypothetical protein [Lamprobacter modestohalophilus]